MVLPAKNEEPTIKRMVNGLLAVYPFISEIVVVNDGSSDRTSRLVRQLAGKDKRITCIDKRPPNGVGHALRAGVFHALKKHDYILIMDSDFLENIPELDIFFKQIHLYDGIIGSRYMPGGQLIDYPIVKRISNRLFHFCVWAFLGIRSYDVSNNLKLYKREVFSCIPFRSSDFAVNAETGIYPLLCGFRIKEVPVKWVARDTGMGLSKFKILRLAPGYVQVFWEALRFKFLWRFSNKREQNFVNTG